MFDSIKYTATATFLQYAFYKVSTYVVIEHKHFRLPFHPKVGSFDKEIHT